jgi:hypothetical protein
MEKGIFVNAIIPQRMGTALSGLTKICDKIRVTLARNDIRELHEAMKADIGTLRELLGELEEAFAAEKNAPNGQWGKSGGPNAIGIHGPTKALDDAGG